MPDFKFAIGDYVTLKAQVEIHGLRAATPMSISERLAQQCEGGEQRHYDCRLIHPPEGTTWGGRRQNSAVSVGDAGGGYYRFKEAELVTLDVAAYREARKDPLDEIHALASRARQSPKRDSIEEATGGDNE